MKEYNPLMAYQEAIDLFNRLKHERNAMSKSILEAAAELGIITRDRCGYSGPEILLLLNDVKELAARSNQVRQEKLEESLAVMTDLCRLKYGNMDKDVYAEIVKAETLLKERK